VCARDLRRGSDAEPQSSRSVRRPVAVPRGDLDQRARDIEPFRDLAVPHPVDHDAAAPVVDPSDSHIDFDMSDDKVVTDRPDIHNSLLKRAAGEFIEHLRPLDTDGVAALEMSDHFRDRGLEVPDDLFCKRACVAIERPMDERFVPLGCARHPHMIALTGGISPGRAPAQTGGARVSRMPPGPGGHLLDRRRGEELPTRKDSPRFAPTVAERPDQQGRGSSAAWGCPRPALRGHPLVVENNRSVSDESLLPGES
jgi:hypothetical protein